MEFGRRSANDEGRTPAEPADPLVEISRAPSERIPADPRSPAERPSGQASAGDELLSGRDDWMYPELRLASEGSEEIPPADQDGEDAALQAAAGDELLSGHDDWMYPELRGAPGRLGELAPGDLYGEDAALEEPFELQLEDELNRAELLLARSSEPGIDELPLGLADQLAPLPVDDLAEPWPPVEQPSTLDFGPPTTATRAETMNTPQIDRAASDAQSGEATEGTSTGDGPGAVDELDGVHLLTDDELEETGRGLVDLLHPEAWARADIGERMVMAQRAHAFIRQAYGLKASPLFYDLNLPPQVAGRFESSNGQVSINAALLEDDHPGELLDTLAHENRHAVQAELLRELHDSREQDLAGRPRHDVDWSVVDGWTEAWRRYDANDAPAYYANELEVDARRAGLQLAGNGYWRAYMDRLDEGGGR